MLFLLNSVSILKSTYKRNFLSDNRMSYILLKTFEFTQYNDYNFVYSLNYEQKEFFFTCFDECWSSKSNFWSLRHFEKDCRCGGVNFYYSSSEGH